MLQEFNCNANIQCPKGGSLEPGSPDIFVKDPGAQTLSLLGAWLILAKWRPGEK